MRFGLILCVLGLTAFTFFLAASLPQASGDAAAMQTLVDDAEVLAKTISDLEAENAEQKSQILALSEADGDPDQALSSAMEQLRIAENAKDELIAANSELSEKVSLLAEQNADAQRRLIASETIATDLAAEIESERARLQALETELSASMDATRASASEQLAELQTRIDETEGALTAAQQRIALLTAAENEQEEVVATLRLEAATAERTINSLQTEIATLSTLIAANEVSAANSADNAPTVAFCTEQTRLVMANNKLDFDRGTARISSESMPALTALIDVARECADANLVIEIGGHTDSQGGELSNLTLSEDRARAVLDFLFSGGVPSVAMSAIGYGESQPIADNGTADGRSENRRITFSWRQR